MSSAPIRQPRGPPSSSLPAGPPQADAEALLRRNKTVATSKHQERFAPPSASVARTGSLSGPHGAHRSAGFGGGGYGSPGMSPGPSPSLSASLGSSVSSSSGMSSGMGGMGGGGGMGGMGGMGAMSGMGPMNAAAAAAGMNMGMDGLVRRGSERYRAAGPSTEETLVEADEGPADRGGTWGKSGGLTRQSSLPSRRLSINPGLFSQPGDKQSNLPPPPPRPPRRVYNDNSNSSNSQNEQRGSHAPSHSMSSLSVVVPQNQYDGSSISPVLSTPGSAHGSYNLHAGGANNAAQQQQQGQSGGVSRTQSLRMQATATSPVEYSNLGRSASMRTPGEMIYSRMSPPPPPHPFSLATPPRGHPNNLPGLYSDEETEEQQRQSDLRRHQSMTEYGSSSRVQQRLERSQALLSLGQREDLRRQLGTSPAESQSGTRRHSRHPSEMGGDDTPGLGRSVWTPGATGEQWPNPGTAGAQQLQDALDALSLRDPQPHDEPSWVTNLVGMPGQPSPQPPSSGRPQLWENDHRYAAAYGGVQNMQQPLPPPPLSLYQQQQQQMYGQQLKLGMPGGIPQVPVLPMQYNYLPYAAAQYQPAPAAPQLSEQDLDVIELARSKGLNPATFDCHPPYARFFVIKSYTEDDVQKSLKHEIWSSTVLGNKRLDAAYRESHERGPIYLFFSVNGSRHFCGVAEMISPVDETATSNVWAQDKWKGLFNVRWRMVRDVPTSALRHLRLTNTQDQKPITQSRDSTELPYEVGCAVLQIFLDHQHKSKTSLLQDFAYYERLSQTRDVTPGAASPAHTAPHTPHQHAHGMHHTPPPFAPHNRI